MNFRLSNIIPQNLQNRIILGLRIMIFLISVVTFGAIIVDYGFVLDEIEIRVIDDIYKASWWFYFAAYIFRIAFQWTSINRKTAFLTIISGLLLLLTAIPKFTTQPIDAGIISHIWHICNHKYLLLSYLGLSAILEVSKGIVSFINKKTNPALIMAAGFAIIILFGALLLLLPRSTIDGIRLSVVDGLFISTSAVCVTGLAPMDIATTFTREGQIVIASLIQIGGLGVMTITSFFAMFFMGGTGLYNQFALRDMIGSDTFSSLISTLLYIIGFTFAIEGIGAICIWLSIHNTLGITLNDEIFFSIFHAISAFCNAGFSTLPGNLGNPIIINSHNGFFIVISTLILLGGIGFPILMNFWHMFLLKVFKRKSNKARHIHLANINTKIVLTVTSILLIGGTLAMVVTEWNGAFASMRTDEKFVHALFNAVSPRTAGFNSVDLTQFSLIAIIFYIILMWIGGASQSTAGGIKVNTLAVIYANFVAVVRGRDHAVLFEREISGSSIRRASAMVFGSIITIGTFFIILLILEPELSAIGLLFETFSAFCTVGSSLGITPQLGLTSKLMISLLMFIGRVGLITVLMSFIPGEGTPKYRLPKDNVIIN